MKNNPILKTENLSVWYNGLQALKNINLDIPRNKVTALIGASGSGKSTYLRAINRMIDFASNSRTDGAILFQDKNVLDKDLDVISLRRKIGMVFQNPTPFPKSIYDNIAFGLEVQGIGKRKTPNPLKIFMKEKIDYKVLEKSDNLIDRTVVASLKEAALWDEVKDRLHVSAYKLSGGQQQRLCVARAVAVKPEILLLDEPCSQLDPISTKKIEDLINKLKTKYTIVIVTHNMQQAKRISDYVGFFHLGELLEFGETKQIFTKAKNKITNDYVNGYFG